MRLKTILADDEPLARERLRFLLATDSEIEIAAECRNGREVLAALQDPSINLLFLDIEMPGHDGFSVMESAGTPPATVFVTAHTHYALRAFDVHAVDYLTKPVEAERLRGTLARVRERIAGQRALLSQDPMSAPAGLGTHPKERYPRRLLVPSGSRDCFVDVEEIDWIEAADYYACLHVGGRTLMLRETMHQLASTLDPEIFVRIHRSAVVNMNRVTEICRAGRSEGAVLLSNGQRLRMSRKGWQALLAASRRSAVV